ncbi:MAG: zinc-binding dehydrogenase [Phenylobacterium sp.]|uniref:medium chain dehydrogenase/reductase family protein n=1 Tax=Phenylobacterium sp. TaxID=1871053 RepID=UPI001A476655|nr:medium chain dehydrogenase/reductase family protein [Phenylobacterium sp.]MBL8553493.1 zinc-binding dehydrogenase [Phenylobacterium sp.]
MKAAVLNAFGSPLDIQTLPDPLPGAGSVIVDIVAAGVTSYAANVFNGSRNYQLDPPVAPGAGGIGRVRATGPDSTRLRLGEWVYCEPTIRSRDALTDPDTILQGWTYRTPAARPLHAFYHHGSFAEQMLLPTENATPLGDIRPDEAGRWTALGRLLVPYGGLLAGDLQAGETVVVSGASGGFGGAGVAVALAMGAGRVVATGRNLAALEDIAARLGPRVRPVRMAGDEAADRARIVEAADGPVDMVLDFLPREASASQVMAAATAVRHGGRIVLMGGLRGAAGDLPLNYNWLMHNDVTVRGKWMYERDAIPRMIRLIRAGLVDLGQFEMAEFPLDEANAAVAHAAANAGPRQLTVLRPDR